METPSDQQLLRDYAKQGSQPAFEELVRRHIDLVYSVALRIVRHAEGAEDVTQCAFTALAQKASQVAEHPVLSGWLHLTARNLAAKAVRSEVRRRAREREAAVNRRLADQSDSPWDRVAPHLDAALGELSDAERGPLLLRYFERKSAREIGQTLGINEEAAQKRVSRAVERLREVLARRDVSIGTSAMVLILTTNVVQSAPPTLSAAVVKAAGSASGMSAAAAGKGLMSFSGLTKPALALGAGLAILGLAVVLFWQPPAGSQRTPPNPPGTTMQFLLTSVMVDDQEKALRFYTEVLGLVTKIDIPAGGARWLTVVSPDEPEGTELLLEPLGLPAAGIYQKQLFEAGIPWTSFAVGDLQREYTRMKQLGTSFKVEPTAAGPTTMAVFDDTCGNLIQFVQAPTGESARAPFRVKIKLSRVIVKDQERALKFYTEALGFTKKRDLPAGDSRWLTVVSPKAPEGTELLLERTNFQPSGTFQAAVREAGIPFTAFVAANVQSEYERLKKLGVEFTMAPTDVGGGAIIAMFDDTCGNLIQIFQK